MFHTLISYIERYILYIQVFVYILTCMFLYSVQYIYIQYYIYNIIYMCVSMTHDLEDLILE
jgi:hypothetical protein